jgi:hypothetical protein
VGSGSLKYGLIYQAIGLGFLAALLEDRRLKNGSAPVRQCEASHNQNAKILANIILMRRFLGRAIENKKANVVLEVCDGS